MTRLLVDSAGARMATLELKRLQLAAAGHNGMPAQQQVDQRIEVLERQVAELPHAGTARRIVTARVLQGLAEREAGLLIQRRQLRVSYTAEFPAVQAVEAELHALTARRTALQASLDSSLRGR